MTNKTHTPPLAAGDWPEIAKTAHEAADLARAAILPYFRKAIQVDNKGGAGEFDPVTAADQAAERVIRGHIEQTWPSHGIIGEEFGRSNDQAAIQWIIDPIDGTRSFIIGSPQWGTLIAVTANGTPVIGIMDQPFTRERFFADQDGAFWIGPAGNSGVTAEPVPIRTSARESLTDAILTTTHPDHFATRDDLARFFNLKSKVRLSRYGGDCYNYALLAAGHVDLVVETGLKSYDIAALVPIVERAGGIITTWSGGSAAQGGQIIAASNAALHAEAIAALND